MTECADEVTRVAPDLGTGAVGQEADDSVLLTDRDKDAVALTLRRECDIHTAILRSVCLYLRGLVLDHAGRSLRFERVTEQWAEIADGTAEVYPVAAVTSSEDGRYVGVPIGGAGLPQRTFPAEGNQLIALYLRDEYRLEQLAVRVLCSDPEMRIGVRLALEDAFTPFPDHAGFFLRMPHYHGAVAGYGLKSAAFLDDEQTAQQGMALLMLTLTARAPRFTMHRRPAADVRTESHVGREPLPTLSFDSRDPFRVR